MFVELVKLANRAKTYQEYRLANIIFAYLLDEYFRLGTERMDTEGGPPPAILLWESQDQIGEYSSEVYYDLLNIETYEYLGEGYEIHRLCIPVPLLDSDVAITALKAASVEERGEHGREHQEPSDEEIADLWQTAFGLVEKDTLLFAAQNILDLEENGLTLEQIEIKAN